MPPTMMNFTITTFNNPFSFFCIAAEDTKNQREFDCLGGSTSCPQEAHPGQYVAVMWEDKWVRGVISMETQFMIWLIDYGVFIRRTEKTVFKELSPQLKKIPSKIFEASIHGVMPNFKILTLDMTMENEVCNTWNPGSITKSKELIQSAIKTYFVPVALLSTRCNDIVLGDLYLNLPGKGNVNIVDELEEWPSFLKKTEEAYIENLSSCYVTRRLHRNCILKPNVTGIPQMSLDTTIGEYREICAKAPQLELDSDNDSNACCSTVIEQKGNYKKPYTLTPEEMEEYATKVVEICGREYNVLEVLVNKMKDLNSCERYKDYDTKCLGRGNFRSGRPLPRSDDED